MKKLSFIVLALVTLFCSGCLDMIEELYLRSDGSGKYQITVDMSKLFSDPMLKGIMEESMKNQGEASLEGMNMDTVIFFKDMPEIEGMADDSYDIVKNMSMRMSMNEENKEFRTVIEMPFEKIEQLNKLGDVFQELAENGGDMGGGLMSSGMFNVDGLFQLKGKKLTRLPQPKPDSSIFDEEGMEFVKMFMTDATYKTIYHLPGKVKKCNIPNAVVDGKTVTIESEYMKLMEGDVKTDGYIKFKKN